MERLLELEVGYLGGGIVPSVVETYLNFYISGLLVIVDGGV